MRILLCCFVLLTLSLNSYAQINIMGKVVDMETGEGVPFANVVLKGSYRGTATNFEGEFALNIGEKAGNDSFIISFVGYNSKLLPVADYADGEFHIIKLEPVSYEFENVEIEAKSLFYHTVIKLACRNIEDNYYQQAFNYDMYYRNSTSLNGELLKERQAAVRLYDAQGYRRSGVFATHKQRGYKFLQVRRNFELNSLVDGSTQLDDLLEFDIVRLNTNVLDTTHIYDEYEVELNKITVLNGDSVWVIDYKCKNPRLDLCGDYYATAYSGTIFIKTKDYAVVKNISHYVCSNYSSLGRSFFISEERQEYRPMNIEYTAVTTYKEIDGAYFLSSVQYSRDHKWKHKKSGNIKREKINAELLVTDIKLKNPEQIPNRSYYEEIPYDEEFWKEFNFLVDEKKK